MIDTEHAPVNPETLAAMVSLLGEGGPTPLVRVGNVDQYLVKQALDSGSHGILVPLVNTEAQARSAVAFARYPPTECGAPPPQRPRGTGPSSHPI